MCCKVCTYGPPRENKKSLHLLISIVLNAYILHKCIYNIKRTVIRAPAQEYNNMFRKKRFVFRLYTIRLGGQTHTLTHIHTHKAHCNRKNTVSARCRHSSCCRGYKLHAAESFGIIMLGRTLTLRVFLLAHTQHPFPTSARETRLSSRVHRRRSVYAAARASKSRKQIGIVF